MLVKEIYIYKHTVVYTEYTHRRNNIITVILVVI